MTYTYVAPEPILYVTPPRTYPPQIPTQVGLAQAVAPVETIVGAGAAVSAPSTTVAFA